MLQSLSREHLLRQGLFDVLQAFQEFLIFHTDCDGNDACARVKFRFVIAPLHLLLDLLVRNRLLTPLHVRVKNEASVEREQFLQFQV